MADHNPTGSLGTLPPQQREIIEARIERMIEMLDDLDGDPDLEPSLGGETKFHLDAAGEMRGEVDLESDDVDREPILTGIGIIGGSQRYTDEDKPSGRAALVLSAVGADWGGAQQKLTRVERGGSGDMPKR